jgi:hypothetical protein
MQIDRRGEGKVELHLGFLGLLAWRPRRNSLSKAGPNFFSTHGLMIS